VADENNETSMLTAKEIKSTSPDSAKEKQNLSQAGKDHVVNISLCVKLVIPFIFTVIQGVKIR